MFSWEDAEEEACSVVGWDFFVAEGEGEAALDAGALWTGVAGEELGVEFE